jgi:hypothetical protein
MTAVCRRCVPEKIRCLNEKLPDITPQMGDFSSRQGFSLIIGRFNGKGT